MTADLSRGQAFGPYHIAGAAGAGGMGVVYRAEQRSLARVVALKVIRPDIAQSGDYRSRFLREARLAAAVDHPHVVSVFDVGEQAGRLYLAMQWVDGQDLRTLLDRQRRLAPDRVVLIGTQLAGALQAVHEAGLVHRDVKPSNVLMRDIAGRDHAYLTDFGIARMPGAQDDLTRTGWSVGTPGYLSPEQIRGQRPGPHSDLYALGCLLYEAVTGQRPFGGENDMVMQWAHLSSPRPVVSVACPELGQLYDGFFAQALAVDPRDRFASGRAFSAALQAAHSGRYAVPSARTAQEARAQATVQAARPRSAASSPPTAAGPPTAAPRPRPAGPDGDELDPTRTRQPAKAWPPATPRAGRVGGAQAAARASPRRGIGRALALVGALVFLASVTLLTRYTDNGTGWKSLWQATHHDPASPLVATDFWILTALVALALVVTVVSFGRPRAILVEVLAALGAIGYTIYLPMKGASPGFQPYGSSFWLSLAAAAVMALGGALALGGRRAKLARAR